MCAWPVPTLLGATDADEISFGPNMTTITFALSRAIGATMQAGDEIVVTKADHDANVAPWLAIAASARPGHPRGRHRAGRRHPRYGRARARAMARARGSWRSASSRTASAPSTPCPASRTWPTRPAHSSSSMRSQRCRTSRSTWLPWAPTTWSARPTSSTGHTWACSGVVVSCSSRCPPTTCVRPATPSLAASRPGTKPFELLAGLGGTLRYLEKVGITQGGAAGLPGQGDRFRRPRLLAALSAIRRYEIELGRQLLERVSAVPGVRVYGITDPARGAERCPTVAFTLRGP